MKLTVQNTDLQTILAAAAAVTRSPDPIKIIAERIGDAPDDDKDYEERPAEAGQIRIIAFNDTMVIEWTRPAEIKMSGSVAIHPDGLTRLVKASRNSDSTFVLETIATDNERSLRLNTARSAHEFPAVSDAVFDTIVPGRANAERANLSNLSNAISTAKIAAAARGDASGGRVMLTGVHLRQRDDTLDVVGTDGRRMSVITLRMSDLGGLDLGDADAGVTLPPEALPMVTEMLSAPSACLKVFGNNVVVETADGSLSVRVIDAPYPDYSVLLGVNTDKTLVLPKSSLEIALQRSSVALVRDKRSVAVKLSRGADGVYVTSSAAGQSSSECVHDTPGDEASIGFDAQYMLSAIGVFGQGDVDLAFGTEQVPIRITSQQHPEIQMLVMPCKTS
jgi:DNA polymerase-3 subunit beta